MADLVSVTQLQNMLKDYYQKTDQDATMEVNVRMWDEIYKNKKDVDGIAVKAIAKVRRNMGISTTAFTNSDEPTAGNRGYERASIQPRFIKAKGLFDQQLVLMSKTDTGSFIKELAAVTDDLEESVKLNLARQVFGDGSGKLAELTANVTAANPATVYVHDTQYLEVGLPFAVYTAAGVFVEASSIITVDPETKSFTANIANNLQSLYYITFGESSTITNKATEITGLGSMQKDNTYYGINRANFPMWRPAVLGVGTGLTNRPARFQEVNAAKVVNSLMKRSRIKSDTGELQAYDFMMTDLEGYLAHWAGLVAQRFYMDNVTYKTGTTGLLFDGKQIERDAYCPKDHLAIARVTAYNAGVVDVNTTAAMTGTDLFEIYRGALLIGHLHTNTITDADTVTGTFVAYDGGVPAAGDLMYLDNEDTAHNIDYSASLVAHNAYFINKDTWQWYIWQDITNYTEQLIGLEFVKVANKTQYEFTLTGLMELFNETPTKNGRYRYSIGQSYDTGLNM